MSEQKPLKIKFYEEEILIHPFQTYSELCSFIKCYFKIDEDKFNNLSIFYYDSDGDQISFQGEVDYKLFLEEETEKKEIECEFISSQKSDNNENDPLKSGAIFIKKPSNIIDIDYLSKLSDELFNNKKNDYSKINEVIKENENDINKVNKFNNKNGISFNEQINKLNNEIINLKNELNNKNQIINQQQTTIANLQYELNNMKKNEQKITLSLVKKEQELITLKNELINSKNEIIKLKENIYNTNFENNKGKNYFAINFLSIDQKINYPIVCNSNTIISRLEEEVYNEYPAFKDNNTYLTFNGKTLKRFKSIEENGIKKGDKILVNIYE